MFRVRKKITRRADESVNHENVTRSPDCSEMISDLLTEFHARLSGRLPDRRPCRDRWPEGGFNSAGVLNGPDMRASTRTKSYGARMPGPLGALFIAARYVTAGQYGSRSRRGADPRGRLVCRACASAARRGADGQTKERERAKERVIPDAHTHSPYSSLFPTAHVNIEMYKATRAHES